jgi:hypothetical protein
MEVDNGDGNFLLVNQQGFNHSSEMYVADSAANDVGVFQEGSGQTSTIDLVDGSGENDVVVLQLDGWNNVSDINLDGSSLNVIVHSQTSIGDLATTSLSNSNGNIVSVVQN